MCKECQADPPRRLANISRGDQKISNKGKIEKKGRDEDDFFPPNWTNRVRQIFFWGHRKMFRIKYSG